MEHEYVEATIVYTIEVKRTFHSCYTEEDVRDSIEYDATTMSFEDYMDEISEYRTKVARNLVGVKRVAY